MRSLSDASESADDDEFLSAAFDELEEEEATEATEEAAGGSVARATPNATQFLDTDDVEASLLTHFFPYSGLVPLSRRPTRFQRLLVLLQVEQPSMRHVQGLTELYETCALSPDASLRLSDVDVEAAVTALVALLSDPSSMEVLLLAIRTLTALLDQFPALTMPSATAEQLLRLLCANLRAIEYLDVAEHVLTLLEHLLTAPPDSATTVYRTQTIQEHGFHALLASIDFFPLPMQRQAVHLVVVLCHDVPLALAPYLSEDLPSLPPLVHSSDPVVSLSTLSCLDHLSHSPVSHDPMILTHLTSNDLLTALLEMVARYPEGPFIAYKSIFRVFAVLLQRCSLKRLFHDLPPLLTNIVAQWQGDEHKMLLYAMLPLVELLMTDNNTVRDEMPRMMLLSPLALQLCDCLPRVYDVTERFDLQCQCLTTMWQACGLVFARDASFTVVEQVELTRWSAFVARLLQPKDKQTMEWIKDKDLEIQTRALALVHVPLQHSKARKAAKSALIRHGVVESLRFYAGLEGNEKLKEVALTAKMLLNVYFEIRAFSGTVLMELKPFVAESREWMTNTSEPTVEELYKLLLNLKRLGEHHSHTFFTPYEVTVSGIVSVLIRVLSLENGQEALRQLSDRGTNDDFVPSLVQCMQACVSTVCSLSVQTRYGGLAAELEQLTQHIKVHVVLEEGEKMSLEPDHEQEHFSDAKRGYHPVHDSVVLVEPLARIETMEDFISDKVFGKGGNEDVMGEEEVTEQEHERVEGARDTRTSTRRRVVAMYKGRVLPREMSLVEALVKLQSEETVLRAYSVEEHFSFANFLWSATPHDVVFRVDGMEKSLESDIRAFLPCHDDDFLTDLWDLLMVLKLVRRACALQVYAPALSFLNPMLTHQVTRMLHEPLHVVTNTLPPWTFRLVSEFPFVLPFPTRWHFMYTTLSGSTRAIQYLSRSLWRQAVDDEAEEAAEEPVARSRQLESTRRRDGLETITQMVPLGRVKVRVARSRLLHSAFKIVTFYGGPRTAIEIEFIGEVGTGLGPTTEFYTLVWQQLQLKKLELWRDDEARVSNGHDEPDRDIMCKGMEHNSSLVIRGYHRVAVYHCLECHAVSIPKCVVHGQLFTHEKKVREKERRKGNEKLTPCRRQRYARSILRQEGIHTSIPQCAECLDTSEWQVNSQSCQCRLSETQVAVTCQWQLKWWILSDEEVQYLSKVFPKHQQQVSHPVLQCAHCDTVNFPGTDTGIVVMDGDRMVSRSGRRMYERDYRAVTKHISPLCEGTPLVVMTSTITRDDVDTLVENLVQSPEVREAEVEALHFLNETAVTDSDLGTGATVLAPFGLYPKPYLSEEDPLEEEKASVLTPSNLSTLPRNSSDLTPNASTFNSQDMDILSWFRFLGRFVAQAILDERLVNLPLARPFVRALRGEKMVGSDVRIETSLSFLHELDPAIANSLRYLHQLALKYAQKVDSKDMNSDEITVWETQVESLSLCFTMIGADEIALIPGGKDVSVTLSTLGQYVALNLDFFLARTIQSQVQAFRQGFDQIWGDGHLNRFLQAFDVEELETLFSDRSAGDSLWDRDGDELRKHMVCAHGYTAESRAIANLVSILCEFSLEDQRLFVRFVTGANRLPLGGLRNLEPKFTVVRKLPELGDNRVEENDAVLPSASTCTNYLKLPDYSTREVLKQRLVYCIHEGQCSFHLS